jgi:pimeloyl-ACP methyl ester carboxylesterase
MATGFAPKGDLHICYDVVGDLVDPPLLLIAGLGNQLVMWDDEFCLSLVDRGFCVIRFDNRDCGRSSVLADGAEYTLSDMAGDAVAVLDALGIERAHVFGQSMGGMIAQVLAIEHPGRVGTLTVISTSTGNPEHGKATHDALAAVSRPPATDIDAAIELDIANRRIWASPGWFDEDVTRSQLRAAYERSFTPGGSLRQFVAIALAPDREPALAQLSVPTLVMHGTLDPLIGIDGGERLAELIPGAELFPIDGLAHDLPVQVWQQVISALTTHVARHAG